MMGTAGLRAYIVSYRRGSNSQNERYMILEIEGIGSWSEASRLIGKKVLWAPPGKKQAVVGKIVKVHGKSGKVIARFRKPLPGQALGSTAVVV